MSRLLVLPLPLLLPPNKIATTRLLLLLSALTASLHP
jgi:hypothetical protein